MGALRVICCLLILYSVIALFITTENIIEDNHLYIMLKHSIMVVDTDGTTPLAEIDGDGNISSTKHITAANGEITAKTFNARSDKRLKENIVEYSPNKSILDLPIYSYNFISDEKKTKKIGCLAQDLKEICPEIVHEGDNGYLSIEENKLVYLLLEEVKKLKKRVDELEVRNGD